MTNAGQKRTSAGIDLHKIVYSYVCKFMQKKKLKCKPNVNKAYLSGEDLQEIFPTQIKSTMTR